MASSAASAAPMVRMQWWMRPGPQTALRDFEAAPFAEQQIFRRHAHVLELDFHVPVRRVVIAEHRERTLDRDALRIERHEDLALLRVLGAIADRSCP